MRKIKKRITEYLVLASFFAILIIFHGSNALAATVLPSKGYIDVPSNGQTINGIAEVRGWFLDGSGVAKVEVLVDGKLMGQATYGLTRLDVAKAYPAYNNSTSGYQYSLSTSNLTNGQHSLTVRETGNNGQKSELTRSINVQKLTTRGSLDAPVNGSTISGDTLVKGWFLDVSGVAKIDILVDGKLMGQAQYGLPRSDVQRAYPEYNNANSGYQYTLTTANLTNGQHVLTVRESGKDGAVTEKKILFTVQQLQLPTKGSLDAPRSGATIYGDSIVRGWFLDASGVAKIDVLIDGQTVGQAEYGYPRDDVENAYPDYQNGNSGYQYTLATQNLTNGQHVLTVREISKSGAVFERESLITISKLPTKGSLDAPENGAILDSKTLVRGWFLDGAGVDKVEVMVDGKVVGQAEYGLLREDVEKVYPQYQNTDSGYQFTLDPNTMTNGKHDLIVKETSKSGSTMEIAREIYVQNLPSKGSIDEPTTTDVIKGDRLVRGWLLDGSSVAKVEVLVDENKVGEAEYGFTRTDVLNAFPDYGNGNAGYEFTLKSSMLADGEHTLTIKETGKNGNVFVISKTIYTQNGNPYLLLDLMKPSNITATDIVNFFNNKSPNSPLKDYAQSFIDAQNKYGVNAQYLVAHAIWETGWGGSDLRTYKHNLFGYGAYNVCPFTCGYYFPTGPDSINSVAYMVRTDYLDSTGKHFNGPNLTGMNIKYATDPNWKNGIANLMASIKPYNFAYYSSVSDLPNKGSVPTLTRDIPAGQSYPEDTVLSFPSGITAKVNTSSLNFRSLPYASSSTLIGTLSLDTTVTLVGLNTDVLYAPGSTGNYADHWFRVKANGTNGWLYGYYLNIDNLLQVREDAGSLRVRSTPSTTTTDNILTSLDEGTYVKAVLSNGKPVTQDGWYNIYLPNSSTTGWVSGEFVQQILH